MAGLREYVMFWPSRKTLSESPSPNPPPHGEGAFVSTPARAVLCDVRVEVVLVRLEVRRPRPIREVEEVAGLGWVDAGEQRRATRVADRAGRQPGVLARVVRTVQRKLGPGGLRRKATQAVEQRGVDAERHVDRETVVVDAAHVAAVGGGLVVRLAVDHGGEDHDGADILCRT